MRFKAAHLLSVLTLALIAAGASVPASGQGYPTKPVRLVVPYAAGGIGWHRLQETAGSFSDAENTDERFTGFHLLGGAELPISRFVATAAEVEWATVPDALGTDPNSVAAAFDEHDLGGFTFRVKIVIGR